MNPFLQGFRSELVKVAAAGPLTELLKTADIWASPAPSGMMSNGPVPPSIDVRPTEAASRLPNASPQPGLIHAGFYGDITQAKEPIDRQKFNRVYEGTRKS